MRYKEIFLLDFILGSIFPFQDSISNFNIRKLEFLGFFF